VIKRTVLILDDEDRPAHSVGNDVDAAPAVSRDLYAPDGRELNADRPSDGVDLRSE